MKKIIASAVGLMLVGGVAATSAFAVESQFGGYWRTRFTYDDNMAGDDTGSNYITDTRTRLYYTAKFSDDLKFVNKFEFNTTWGDANGGDIGADGTGNWKIKNSYADFNLGMVNAKVGIQGNTISRGFIFADDMSGVVLTADFGMVKVPFLYAAAVDEEARGNHLGDTHLFSVMPTFKVGDAVKLTPHFTYLAQTGQEVSLDGDTFWLGIDADMKMDAFSAWGTAIYNFGQIGAGDDISAWLVAAGVDAGIVHGQAFYATGDDDAADTDHDEFQTAPGSSYYWSEIMGLGMFDNNDSNGSPDDNITNVWAANVGVSLKPMEKLGLDFDVWYAALAEDNAAGDTELGLEFDAKVSYELVENLNADFVFAYLVAGDATGNDDVIESGLQLSLKF
jgi:hypothetical protein